MSTPQVLKEAGGGKWEIRRRRLREGGREGGSDGGVGG